MRLFAALYLDEDVSVLLARLLQGRGLDATTAVEEGMLGQPDEAQLERAVSLSRCIVTHNRRDFEQLHARYVEQGRAHFGIIVATRRDVYDLARRLVTLLDALAADEIENQLLYI